jgi:hypothetical protein
MRRSLRAEICLRQCDEIIIPASFGYFRKVGPAILPASPLSSGLLGVFEESLLESRLAARIGGPTTWAQLFF